MKIDKIKNIRLEDLTWIAGIIEGEGSLSHNKTASGLYSPLITVAMTDKDIVERFARLLGGYTVGKARSGEAEWYYGRQTQWRCAVGGKAAMFLAMIIYPWMGERRRKRIRQMWQDYQQLPGKNWAKGLTHKEMGR